MVYCNLISHDDSIVVYDFGGDVKHINGRFEFDYKRGLLNILYEPDTEMPPIRHIHSLLRIHHKEFEKGIFKKKISYEI